MLLEGLILMVEGMGMVFLFLALMVVSTHYSSAFIRRMEAKRTDKAAEKTSPSPN